MSKRQCTKGNDEWRTTRGQTRGDTLVEISEQYFFREWVRLQEQNGLLLQANECLRRTTAAAVNEQKRATRSNERHRLAAQVQHDVIANLRAEVLGLRNLVQDIWTRFPEVHHEYEFTLLAEDEGVETEEEEF